MYLTSVLYVTKKSADCAKEVVWHFLIGCRNTNHVSSVRIVIRVTSYTSDPRYGQLDPDIGAAVAAKKSTSVAKRSRTSMSNDAKVDLVFTKLDELDMIKQLLQCTIDAHAEEEKLSTDMAVDGTSNDNTVHSSTINAVSPSLSSLTVESCSLATSCIDAVSEIPSRRNVPTWLTLRQRRQNEELQRVTPRCKIW